MVEMNVTSANRIRPHHKRWGLVFLSTLPRHVTTAEEGASEFGAWGNHRGGSRNNAIPRVLSLPGTVDDGRWCGSGGGQLTEPSGAPERTGVIAPIYLRASS